MIQRKPASNVPWMVGHRLPLTKASKTADILAGKVGERVEIYYDGAPRSRSVVPLELFSTDRNPGVEYLEANCLRSDSVKIFRLDKIRLVGDLPQGGPTDIRFNVETDLAKSVQTFSGGISDRPKCKNLGCENPVEIKGRVEGRSIYRTVCSRCHRSKATDVTDTSLEAKRSQSNQFSEADTSVVGNIQGTPSERGVDSIYQDTQGGSGVNVDTEYLERSFQEIRLKLLDLSRRNPLINFRHSETGVGFIRVVDEVPDQLLEKLRASAMDFLALPDLDQPLPDEQTVEFQGSLREAKLSNQQYLSEVSELEGLREVDAVKYMEGVLQAEMKLRDVLRGEMGLPPVQRKGRVNLKKHAELHGISPDFDLATNPNKESHGDKHVQTLMLREQLDRRLRNVYTKYSTHIKETGINVLQIAIGFLEWYDSPASEKPNLSPLLLLPLEMSRRASMGGFTYEVSAPEGELGDNLSLSEKLKQEFGVVLPTPGEDTTVSEHMAEVAEAIKTQPRWKVRSYVTVGLFPFSTILLYTDNQPDQWPGGALFSHEKVARLLGGLPANETSFIEGTEDIDALTKYGEAPPLITQADSSQHSALRHIFNGESLVIQGPPGTGKSQTITNIIAGAVLNGKRVLFLAEKQPALNVVRNRLADSGLSPLILEPRRGGGDKGGLHESLRERLELRESLSDLDYTAQKKALIDRIGFNDLFKELLSEPTPYCGKTAFELIWHWIRLRHDLMQGGVDTGSVIGFSVAEIDQPALNQARTLVEELIQLKRVHLPDMAPFMSQVHGIQSTELSIKDFKAESEALIDALSAATKIPAALGGTLGNLTPLDARLVLAKICSFPVIPEDVISLDSDTRDLEHQIANSEIADRIEAVESRFPSHKLGALYAEAIRLSTSVSRRGECLSIEAAQRRTEELHRRLRRVEACLSVFETKTSLDACDRIIRLVMGEYVQKREKIANQLDVFAGDVQKLDGYLTEVVPVLRGINAKLKRVLPGIELHSIYARTTKLRLQSVSATLLNAGFWGLLKPSVRDAKRHLIALGVTTTSPSEVQLVLQELIALFDKAETLTEDAYFGKLFHPTSEVVIPTADALGQLESDVRDLVQLLSAVNSEGALQTKVHLDSDMNSLIELAAQNEDLLTKDDDFSSDMALEAVRESLLAGVARNTEVIAQLTAMGVKRDELFDPFLVIDEIEELRASLPSELQSGEDFADEIANRRDSFRASGRYLNAHERASSAQRLFQLQDLQDALVSLRSLLPGSVEEGPIFTELRLRDTWLKDQHRRIGQLLDDYQTRWGVEANLFSSGSCNSLIDEARRSVDTDTSMLIISVKRNALERVVNSHHARVLLERLRDESIEDTQVAWSYFDYHVTSSILRKFAARCGGTLQQFSSLNILKNRQEFRSLDAALKRLEARRALSVATRSTRDVPLGVGSGPVRSYTELNLIRHELAKQRGHISTNNLIKRATAALLKLKPIWLMQPLTVSQLLPRKTNLFDLVVIDEASQMLPEYATAAIARGAQLVVVGDKEQMPPSTLFTASREYSEEDAPEIESESILDLAAQRLGNSISLRWHYRSRHPSLIAFSNKYFYQNRLEVVPSPILDTQNLGVKHIFIDDGDFRDRLNRPEANRVIVEAKKIMAHSSHLSIGIVAMNAPQADFIQEEMSRLSDTDPIVRDYYDQWGDDELNFPLITNLENVQGDERDVIIISTVYGPSKDVGMFQRFPLINTPTGHRRLNVLFTRARSAVLLVTSMRPSNIDISEGAQRGKVALRDYIEYASTGRMDVGEVKDAEPDSDFEIFVMNALRSHGYECVPQVGVRKFRIDIGVRDPRMHSTFLAGIECDGATYHSSSQARDRDVIRQDILESLGWKIYRIWSTDWFEDPERETKKMIAWLERLTQIGSAEGSGVRVAGSRPPDSSPGSKEPPSAVEAPGARVPVKTKYGWVDLIALGEGSYELVSAEAELLGSIRRDSTEYEKQSLPSVDDALLEITKSFFIAQFAASGDSCRCSSLVAATEYILEAHEPIGLPDDA